MTFPYTRRESPFRGFFGFGVSRVLVEFLSLRMHERSQENTKQVTREVDAEREKGGDGSLPRPSGASRAASLHQPAPKRSKARRFPLTSWPDRSSMQAPCCILIAPCPVCTVCEAAATASRAAAAAAAVPPNPRQAGAGPCHVPLSDQRPPLGSGVKVISVDVVFFFLQDHPSWVPT